LARVKPLRFLVKRLMHRERRVKVMVEYGKEAPDSVALAGISYGVDNSDLIAPVGIGARGLGSSEGAWGGRRCAGPLVAW
jgi:hypothetical protein